MCTLASAIRRSFLSVAAFSSLAVFAASAAPEPPQQRGTAKTMDEVIDRVVINENRLNSQISQYTPLVETYIQNLKPDKDLGYIPAGDKYFLGRAQFSKGVAWYLLPIPAAKARKSSAGIGNFFSLRHAVPAGRLFADDLHRYQRLRHASITSSTTCAANSWAKCVAWFSTSLPPKNPVRAVS